MRFWPRLFEKKQTDEDILALLGVGTTTYSGVGVSAEVALRVPAVSRAITLISGSIASFPLIVERRVDDAWVPDTEHRVAKLIDAGVNDWTSSPEFVRDTIIAALLNDAGAMAWVNRVGGEVREIIAYRSGIIGVDFDPTGTGEPRYRVNGTPTHRDDIIHLKTGFARSPVSRAREAIGAALIMERHAAAMFRNGARPSGQILSPKTLGDEGVRKMLRGFMAAHGGAENSGGTPVFWDGTRFEAIQMTSVDAQFLEMRKEQTVEIARAMGVPPAFLFEMGRATWGNFEQQSKAFLASLETWMQPFEASMRRALFNADEREDYRIVFDRDDFSAVDLTARATAISSLISSRVINPNEARPWVGRGLAPYAGGDEYQNPHTGSSQPQAEPPKPEPKPDDEEDEHGSE